MDGFIDQMVRKAESDLGQERVQKLHSMADEISEEFKEEISFIVAISLMAMLSDEYDAAQAISNAFIFGVLAGRGKI